MGWDPNQRHLPLQKLASKMMAVELVTTCYHSVEAIPSLSTSSGTASCEWCTCCKMNFRWCEPRRTKLAEDQEGRCVKQETSWWSIAVAWKGTTNYIQLHNTLYNNTYIYTHIYIYIYMYQNIYIYIIISRIFEFVQQWRQSIVVDMAALFFYKGHPTSGDASVWHTQHPKHHGEACHGLGVSAWSWVGSNGLLMEAWKMHENCMEHLADWVCNGKW